MGAAQVNTTVQVAGLTIIGNATQNGEGQIGQDPTLPAGKAGTLTTRTDNDTGGASPASGHGVTISDTVDVYWSGGMRYGMDVTDVNGDLVTIDLGAGDNLPAQDDAVVVTPRVEVDLDFDADKALVTAAGSSGRAHVEFTTEADASVYTYELAANGAWHWVKDQGTTNPLAGNIVGKAQVSCGESAQGCELKIGVLYDSVA